MADFLDEYTWAELNAMLAGSECDEVQNSNQPVSEASNYIMPIRKQIGNEQKSRFEAVNPEKIQEFINAQENENTRRKTQADMKLFRQFCNEQGEDRPVEQLDIPELDQLFGNFLAVVKKSDHSEYEPSSIRGLLSSLERHLRKKGYSQAVNKNPLFSHINNTMKAKMTYLKSQGYGSKPNAAEEITDVDIDNLFECGQLGIENATQIINLLHITFSLVMGMRGGREQHTLKWGDIEIHTDEDGDKYLEHSRERQTKTRTGTDHTNVRKFKPKAWENKDNLQRCPVQAYNIYKDNRPQSMMKADDPFFLSINHVQNRRPETAWFKSCGMGINHIYGLLKNMRLNCRKIEKDRKITNHSVRKHLMQKCNDLGLPANCTIQISGHKNVGSANNYSKINEKQQKVISTALTATNTIQTTNEACVPTQNSKLLDVQSRSTSNEISECQPKLGLCYSQQATSSRSEQQSIFHGSTVIHGGTFNFFTPDMTERKQSPRRGYKRILPLNFSSDEDE